MSFAKVKRPAKQNKSKVLTLRITEEENVFLNKLKEDLQFETIRELIIFSTDVVKELDEWKLSNYRFFIGKPEESENDFKEVEFEFRPNLK